MAERTRSHPRFRRTISGVGLELSIDLLRAFSFADVHVAGVPADLDPNEPVLLGANHVSWWDGFLLRYVGRLVRPGALHVSVMSAGQLATRPFLKSVGAIGVDESISGVRQMYREITSVREATNGRLLVSYFPQGRIWPSTRRPLVFRRGVEGVIRALAPLTVVPIAIAIEPLATFRPHAFLLLGEPIRASGDGLNAGQLEGAVAHVLDRLVSYLAATGEDAARLWSSAGGL